MRSVTATEAGNLLKEGWVILDVRPPNEVTRVPIQGATAVPLFIIDDEISPGAFLKQASAFGMGGWWLGGKHMKANVRFLPDVQANIPKDAKIVVVCQKGLRSLAACEQLSRAGYETLAWLNGGMDTARVGDIPVVNDTDPRYAGIGGVSALIGWTEVQQEAALKAGGNSNVQKFFTLAGVILAVDLALLAYEKIGYLKETGQL